MKIAKETKIAKGVSIHNYVLVVDRKVNFAKTDWLTKRTGTNSCSCVAGSSSFKSTKDFQKKEQERGFLL